MSDALNNLLRKEKIKKLPIDSALQAGKLLKDFFYSQNISIESKSSSADLVANVDFLVEEKVIDNLEQ